MQVDRHLQAVQLARDCVELGARHHTIRVVTGLSDTVLSSLFADQTWWKRCGRTPVSTDTYLNQSLPDRVEVCLFANLFDEVFKDTPLPAEALVASYRLYLRYCGVRPRVSFDVAFMIASDLRGLWHCEKPRLTLVACTTCQKRSLASCGATFVGDCPFCRIVDRYWRDRRVRSHFPPTSLTLAHIEAWRPAPVS